jgi:hypothetical protein
MQTTKLLTTHVPIPLANDCEKEMNAVNLARLLSEAEVQIDAGQTRPVRAFLADFKDTHGI